MRLPGVRLHRQARREDLYVTDWSDLFASFLWSSNRNHLGPSSYFGIESKKLLGHDGLEFQLALVCMFQAEIFRRIELFFHEVTFGPLEPSQNLASREVSSASAATAEN